MLALQRADMLGVDAVERQREVVGVALAPYLAIGDDVDPGAFHVADRQNRRIVLRGRQERLRNPPDIGDVGPRHAMLVQRSFVHQPLGLRDAANHGGRQQMSRIWHGRQISPVPVARERWSRP